MSKKLISILIIIAMTSVFFSGCMSSESVKKQESKPAVSQSSQPAASSTSSQPKKIIRISIGPNEKHPAYLATAEKFKPLVEQKTNGRYEVQLFANAQLGDDIKATEGVRNGTIDAVITSTSPLGGMIPEIMVFDLPFLFPNEKVADAIMDGNMGKKLADLFPSKGLVLLAWYENGYRQLTNSVREVKAPADLKGLKIRTMENPIHLAAWKMLGANPTPMPFSEVFTALQQKTIDGQENPVPTIYSAKLNEVQKYCSLLGLVYTPHIFLFSKKVFDQIPKEDQDIILAAAKEATPVNRKYNRDISAQQMTELKSKGMIFTELTKEQQKAFQDATAAVWDQFAEKIGKQTVEDMKAELAKLK